MKSRNMKYEEALDRRIAAGITVVKGDTLDAVKVRAGIRATDGRFNEQIWKALDQTIAAQEKETKRQKKAADEAKLAEPTPEVAKAMKLAAEVKNPDTEANDSFKAHRPRGKGKKAKNV